MGITIVSATELFHFERLERLCVREINSPGGIPLTNIAPGAWRQGAGWALVAYEPLPPATVEREPIARGLALATFYSFDDACRAFRTLISDYNTALRSPQDTPAVHFVRSLNDGKPARFKWLSGGASGERQRVVAIDPLPPDGVEQPETAQSYGPVDDSQPAGIPLISYREWCERYARRSVAGVDFGGEDRTTFTQMFLNEPPLPRPTSPASAADLDQQDLLARQRNNARWGALTQTLRPPAASRATAADLMRDVGPVSRPAP